MSFENLVSENRTRRRFYGDFRITRDQLVSLVDLARMTPSTANSQALKFMLVCDEEGNKKVYETLAWAGYFKDWNGPDESERPTAYIIILTDYSRGRNKDIDVGITAQTMMLGAVEMGLGGCMLGAINRPLLAESFGIDMEKYGISLCLALGKPKEEVHIVDMADDGSVKYYRDENGVHYVPKRKTEDLIY